MENRKRVVKQRCCKTCGRPGHNSKTCASRPVARPITCERSGSFYDWTNEELADMAAFLRTPSSCSARLPRKGSSPWIALCEELANFVEGWLPARMTSRRRAAFNAEGQRKEE